METIENDVWNDNGLSLTGHGPRRLEVVGSGMDRDETLGHMSPADALLLADRLTTWARAQPPEPLDPLPQDEWPLYSLMQGGLPETTIERLRDAGYQTVGSVRHATNETLMQVSRLGQKRIDVIREVTARLIADGV